ncbi:Organic cation transporter 1-like protein [Dinothrombium tinctorium]|uniref:Organic cation transporter 1-like protein n=1 Tax=Dinothrombium tinctorium TaxID=1965070 RepID=A0A3S3NZ78_9ACAR|nr:Organic cation transporter 1-like protein [Dinothrombium tinctorium]
MAFEDVLAEVGDFGWYQKRLCYFFQFPVSLVMAWISMPTYFMLATPDHWCYVPQLSNFSLEIQKKLIRPPKANNPNRLDSCRMYDIDYNIFLNNSASVLFFNKSSENITTKACDNGWTFDPSDYESTAVTELNLYCDRSIWISNIFTCHSIGMVVGTWLYGRHKAFYLTVLTSLISCSSPILFRSLYLVALFRFMNGLVLPSIFHLPYLILKFLFQNLLLVTEIVGPSKRAFIMGIDGGLWALGISILPLVVYLSRNWVNLNIINFIVTAMIFLGWRLLPESPRWLLAEGRHSELYKTLANIARVNGRKEPANLKAKVNELIKEHAESGEKNVSSWDFFTKPGLRKNFLLITFSIVAEDSAYYGLALNFENLEGNTFLNFFMLAVVEIPSSILTWYIIETRLGRRWSNSILLTFGGVLLCIPIMLSSQHGTAITVLSIFAKFVTNTALLITYQQAAELYPTSLRNQGIGINVAAGCIVTLMLPYLSHLGRDNVLIPLTTIGVACVLSGVASTFLPETLNQNLPQEVYEAQQFGKGQKFFSLATKPSKSKVNVLLDT